MNSNANNKRRRLLAGIFVASSCKFATCSPDRNSYLTALAVDRSSSSFEKKTASHGAKHGQSMEVVASAIRRTSNVADANFIDGANARREASHQRRSRRQQQQSNSQSIDSDTQRDLIVGGTAAPPGRFPYAVSLQLEKVLDETSSSTENESGNAEEVSDVHTCGGTLIAMDVVLTAGHCGYEEHVLETTNTDEQVGSVNSDGDVNFGQIPEQIFYGADVGAYDLTTEDTSGYTNMLFEKLVLHPDYTGFHGKGNSRMSLQHDVMLVKLYGASEKPVVKLHNPKLKDEDYIQRDPVQGEELVVMGWGDTDPAIGGEESISLASVLNVATVGYVPNDVCEESKGYSNVQSSGEAIDEMEDYFEYDGTISSDMMCALGDASQDACQGDSGGGLFRLGENFNGDEGMQYACFCCIYLMCIGTKLNSLPLMLQMFNWGLSAGAYNAETKTFLASTLESESISIGLKSRSASCQIVHLVTLTVLPKRILPEVHTIQWLILQLPSDLMTTEARRDGS